MLHLRLYLTPKANRKLIVLIQAILTCLNSAHCKTKSILLLLYIQLRWDLHSDLYVQSELVIALVTVVDANMPMFPISWSNPASNTIIVTIMLLPIL